MIALPLASSLRGLPMPGKRTPYNHTSTQNTVPPSGPRTAGVTGTTVDRILEQSNGVHQWFKVAMAVVITGTITDGTHSFTLQHSDDGSTWSDVPAKDLQGADLSLGSGDSDASFEQGYVGHKRYLRLNSAVSGATTGGEYGASILLDEPDHPPVTR